MTELRTSRAVTLWYGLAGPTTLPAGTRITVVDHDEDVVCFTYAGLEHGYATADVDLVEGGLPAIDQLLAARLDPSGVRRSVPDIG